MSRITQLAVAKRSVTLLLAGALFFLGISAWGSLKQELLPDIEFPVITIIAPYPGAGAADVEQQVAEPIERSISGVSRLESLQSTSANSIALVVAQFSFGTDVKETLATIEENLRRADLPDGVEPNASALNINASPVILASIAATSEGGLDAAAEIARTEIVPEIQAIDGVARADVAGGFTDRVVVTLDPDVMADNNVSVNQVVGVLQANNLTIPAGQLEEDGTRVPVSTIGRLTSLDELRALVVAYTPVDPANPEAAAEPLTLDDLGDVDTDEVALSGYGRTNGNPSLSLTVTKTTTANTVTVAEAVQERLDEIAARHPDDLTITTVQDLSSFIIESRDGLLREGGLGALFAILTIFLFLGSIRSTLVAAVSIPLSVLTAIVVMQVAGITMNIMTLGGLAVAVGRVVDDAIVVLENIYRHRSLGEDRMTAVLRGPREVAGAITASTLTTVMVFLPLGFVGGLVSQFFLPFALTVSFALLASLGVALTVVPVLAYLFIGRVKPSVDESGEPVNSRWVRLYVPLITRLLSQRWTRWAVLGVAGVLFLGTLAIAPLLPTQFINAGGEKILAVTVAPPAGTTSEAVQEQAREAEAILLADDEVVLVQTSIPGEGDTSFQTLIAAQSGRPANSATMTVRLEDTADLGAATQRLAESLEPVKTDGYDVEVSEATGFSSNGLNVIVSGPSAAEVEAATTAVLDAISDNPDLINVKSDLVKASPEIQVVVDPNEAISVGSTAAQVAGDVRNSLVGRVATRASVAGEDPVDVVVQVDPDAVQTADELGDLLVGTVAKRPLSEIAAVDEVEAQGSITRIDEAPAASITAEITGEDTGAASQSVAAAIDELEAAGAFPAGVEVRLAGVTQQQAEAFSGLFVSMGVAILLVYVMLVLTFNSLVTPFIILFSLPLATIGAFPALLLTGRPIGVSALIGFLMLIGIVVTNAIVLLDLVERLRREGLSTHDALIEGGKTRVRPILMTAIATILALVPLAAGFNQGSIIAAELGTVVIGGLFSSTFLTLIVVPVVYSLIDGAKVGVARRIGSRSVDEGGEPPEGGEVAAPAGA